MVGGASRPIAKLVLRITSGAWYMVLLMSWCIVYGVVSGWSHGHDQREQVA